LEGGCAAPFRRVNETKSTGAHSAQSRSAVKAQEYIYNSVHYLQGMSTCLRTVCLMFELLRKSVLFRCKRAFTEDPHECEKKAKTFFMWAANNIGGFSPTAACIKSKYICKTLKTREFNHILHMIVCLFKCPNGLEKVFFKF
jgi:hypothetical protein